MATSSSAVPTNIRSRIALTPFDEKELADIVISTSDSVDFYLPRVVLILSSPFFRQMLSIPQPAASDDHKGFDRIPVSEDSKTFDILMRLIYPIQNPEVKDISQVEKVLEASLKYDIVEASRATKIVLRSFQRTQPLQVYAIACRLHLEEEAASAARAVYLGSTSSDPNERTSKFTSSIPGRNFIPEMAFISSANYFRLIEYLGTGTETRFTSPASTANNRRDGPHPVTTVPETIFVSATIQPDVRLRSTDNILFLVHSTAIYLASAEKLLGGQSRSTENDEILVDLDSSTLRSLLKCCYPFMQLQTLDLPHAIAVMEAAARYEMPQATSAVRKHITGSLGSGVHAVSVYLIASANGWDAEALDAARDAVAQNRVSIYVPEMEKYPASLYHRLLEFQYNCTTRIRNAIETAFPYVSETMWDTLPDNLLRHMAQRRFSYPTLYALVDRQSDLSDHCIVCGGAVYRDDDRGLCSLCDGGRSAFGNPILELWDDKLLTHLNQAVYMVSLRYTTPVD